MKKLPTAEEFLDSPEFEPDKGISFTDYHGQLADGVPSIMIEFARLHVEAAKKRIASKLRVCTNPESSYYGKSFIDEKTVLSSYPVENIK